MTTAPARANRSPSIDGLRGLIMVVMALDHTRDFFSSSGLFPKFADVSATIFITRWITHVCAPVFVFFAGTSAFLSLQSGRTKSELSSFLLKRGLWILLVEA